MWEEDIEKTLVQFRAARQYKDKPCSFSITHTANKNNPPIYISAIKEFDNISMSSIIIRDETLLSSLVQLIDGKTDYIFVDVEGKLKECENSAEMLFKQIKKSPILTIKPNDYTIEALDALIAQLHPNLHQKNQKKILIIGSGNIGCKIALKLIERGGDVALFDIHTEKMQKIVDGLNTIKCPYSKGSAHIARNPIDDCLDIDILLGCTPGIPAIDLSIAKRIPPYTLTIDVGNGTISTEAIDYLRSKKMSILCLNANPGLKSQISISLETKRAVDEFIFSHSLGDFSIISGGIIGKKGDIIVDNAHHPKRIIGIANGNGDLLYDHAAFSKNIRAVEDIIQENLSF